MTRTAQIRLISALLAAAGCLPQAARAQYVSFSAQYEDLANKVISLALAHHRNEAEALVARYKLSHRPSHDFYAAVALAYDVGRDYSEAIKTCDEGLKSFPSSFILHYLQAKAWLDVGEPEKAEDALKFCSNLKVHPGMVRAQQARVFLARGDLNGALKESSAAIALEPTAPDSWSIHSGVLANMGRYKEALAAIDKAIRLLQQDGGNLALSQRDRAPIREKLGMHQGAIDDYLVFLKSDFFRNTRVLAKVGACYMQMKQPEKAMRYFDMAIIRDQNNMEAHRGKLAALEALHRTEDAAREKKVLHDTEQEFKPIN